MVRLPRLHESGYHGYTSQEGLNEVITQEKTAVRCSDGDVRGRRKTWQRPRRSLDSSGEGERRRWELKGEKRELRGR